MGTQYKLLKYGNNTIENSNIVDTGTVSYHTVTPEYTSGGEQFYKAYLAYLASTFPDGSLHIGALTPNSRGPVIGNIYSVNTVNTDGLPQYSTFIYHNLAGHLESFGTNNYEYYHRNYLDDSNYSGYLDGRYVTLSTTQTITGAKTFTQPIYFSTGGGITRAILAYDASNLGFGITYKEGNPDVMTFSASGNANNITGADLSINGLGDGKVSIRGNEILHMGNYATTLDPRYVNVTGDTMTGNLTFSNANIGIRRVGRSTSWIGGRDGALLRTTSIDGYSSAISIKTTAGSWEIGAYNHKDFQESLILSYATDTNYNAGTNASLNRIIRSDGTTNLITDRSITADYPTGFSGRFTNATWGNQTGSTITGWSTSTSGAIDFRNDNPSSGKLSIKVDGRFYGNEGNYPAMLMQNKNSYWGMGDPDGADTVWIRTTSQGIIPYQSGNAGGGHGSLGTSSWYFSACYADNDYAVHQRSSGRAYAGEWIEFAGTDGLYFPNSGSGTHFYPNTSTTYGGFQMQGKKGGYMGLLLGNTSDYMNVMDNGNDKGFFQQGKRWPFYYNRTNDQVGIFNSSCQAGFNITLQGTTYNTSTFRSAGEIQTTSANSMRLVYGNYGVFQRNDGSDWWFMVTNSGSQYGNYNSLRPFRINIASGLVFMENKTVIGCTASSWIDGQKNNNAAVNVANATDTGSYWPWMRQTNTSSGKYFSFGTLGTAFYWIGSTSSRTGNGYDYGMSFNIANGYLQGCSRVYGAVWNDYAEMREVPEAQKTKWVDEDAHNPNPLAGRCVREVGDDTMVISTARLQRGCKIISDTFGFNIGETETAKTPIAVSGRALVYLAEGRETARSHIGWPVCSGPNGTVSIMTEEEEEKYPSRIVGTISSVPDYEEWGTGKVKVNGRIWIYVR